MGTIQSLIIYSAKLVPVYSFGETSLFTLVKHPAAMFIQRKLKDLFSFAPLIFYGRFYLPIPFKRKVVTVVGKPIFVEQNHSPTEQEIDKYHEMYMQELQELYDNHKEKYDKDRNEDLVIT
jgi:2-acylglycerol O-acyltransferase 2